MDGGRCVHSMWAFHIFGPRLPNHQPIGRLPIGGSTDDIPLRVPSLPSPLSLLRIIRDVSTPVTSSSLACLSSPNSASQSFQCFCHSGFDGRLAGHVANAEWWRLLDGVSGWLSLRSEGRCPNFRTTALLPSPTL